jgi:hypothetical protein
MSVTTGQQLKDLGGGLFSAVSSTEKTRVNAALVRRSFSVPIILASNGAIAESVIFTVPANLVNGIRVKSVYLAMTTGQTKDSDTDYRVFTVKKYTAAGASGVTIASRSTALTGGTAITALVPAALTVSTTAGYADVAAGAPITLTVTDNGTSVACDGSLTIEYEEL